MSEQSENLSFFKKLRAKKPKNQINKDKILEKGILDLKSNDLRILGIKPEIFNKLDLNQKKEFLKQQALDNIILLKGRKEQKRPDQSKVYKTSFRQILSYLWIPYKWIFIATILLSILQSLLFLSIPLGIQIWINDLVNTNNIDFVIRDFLAILVILVFMAIIMFIRIYANSWIGNNIIKNIRDDLFKKIQDASFRFFDLNKTGDLIARSTSDINLLKVLLSSQIAMFIRQTLMVVLAIIIMFTINPIVAIFANLPLPIIFIVMIYYRRKIFPIFSESRQTYGDLTSVVQENIMGIRVIRAFAQEHHEIEKFEKLNQLYFGQNQKLALYHSSFEPMVRTFANISIIIVLVVGTGLVGIQLLKMGDFFALIMLSSFSIEPLFFLSRFLTDMSQVGATCDRIADLLNNKLEDYDYSLPKLPNFPKITGEIDFDHVFVSYENNKHYELKDISFKITPGEQIAILGATGSGKSTLIRLISRFYPISKGNIRIDGKDINKYNLQSIRCQIGVVPQETFLLGRSVLDNLRLGRQDASTDEVVKACRLANIHDFIESLPKKYNNLIGERGVTLSGGQKQRLAIARALIIKPRILILDDSTSNVDVDTEFKIQQAFSSMFEGTTTFIITQRLSTVRHVDRIIVLSHGEIAEIGTHEELLKHKGIYWQLYSTLKVEERSHGLF